MIDFSSFQRLRSAQLTQASSSQAALCVDGFRTEITSPCDGVMRLRIAEQHGQNPLPDYDLLKATATSACAITIQHFGGVVVAHQGALSLSVKPNQTGDIALSLSHHGKKLLSPPTDEHFRGHSRVPPLAIKQHREAGTLPEWCVSFDLSPDAAVYGHGEKFTQLNHRSQSIKGRIEDALGVNTDLSYKNIPFFFSPDGWGIWINTPATVTHYIGYPQLSHRSLVLHLADEALDICFLSGTPAQMLKQLHTLTGQAAMPPYWSYGIWLSKAYYATPEECADTAGQMRSKRMPMDVITLDGRAAWNTNTRVDWQLDPARFTNPKAQIAAIKAHGVKLCVWEYPYLSTQSPLHVQLSAKGYFLKSNNAATGQYETAVFEWVKPADAKNSPFGKVLTPLAPSSIIDFSHPEAYQYWRDAHRYLFDLGVDVIKSDFGEQVESQMLAHNGDAGERHHNAYSVLYNRCVFEATQLYSPSSTAKQLRTGHDDTRPMVWGRDGMSGMQTLPIQWGGDPQTDWGGMVGSIRGGLSYGLSGVPCYAHDVGGFYGHKQPDPDLFVRWVANGIFCSHFRLHGIGPREPWAFGAHAEGLVRTWLNFRMRLLPYIIAQTETAQHTALPLMRAMVLAFPQDRLAHQFDLQYLFGDALLVAPIVQASGEVTVYFPQGEAWYCLATGAKYHGGEVHTFTRGLDSLTVFGREGYGLPLGPELQSTAEMNLQQPVNELWLFGKPRVAPIALNTAFTIDAKGRVQSPYPIKHLPSKN